MSKKNRIAAVLEQLQIISTQAIMRSQLTASKLGLNSTDLETIEILSRFGKSTAGKLAAETGLTTGAVTGVIDRLEKAGYAKREPDPNDRRKVLVSLNQEMVAKKIIPFYQSLSDSIERNLLSKYTLKELELIHAFLKESIQLHDEDMVSLTKGQ
jgi:DNA-binding MarR family transcriptional regulator